MIFSCDFLLVSSALIFSRFASSKYAPMLKDPRSGETIRYVSAGLPLANNLLVLAVFGCYSNVAQNI